jgi:alpha-glucosidase
MSLSVSFWTNEIQLFFNASSGVDVDGLWIDINEPALFCGYPFNDPFEQAAGQGLPPTWNTPMPDKNALILDQRPMMTTRAVTKRAYHGADENLELPPYRIKNAAGAELGRDTTGVSTSSHHLYIRYPLNHLVFDHYTLITY